MEILSGVVTKISTQLNGDCSIEFKGRDGLGFEDASVIVSGRCNSHMKEIIKDNIEFEKRRVDIGKIYKITIQEFTPEP